jgi:hypothetical protein
MAQLPQMAVYYPYIHFRDPSWLKLAALYWPRMVRIVHPDYPTRNSTLQGDLKVACLKRALGVGPGRGRSGGVR